MSYKNIFFNKFLKPNNYYYRSHTTLILIIIYNFVDILNNLFKFIMTFLICSYFIMLIRLSSINSRFCNIVVHINYIDLESLNNIIYRTSNKSSICKYRYILHSFKGIYYILKTDSNSIFIHIFHMSFLFIISYIF